MAGKEGKSASKLSKLSAEDKQRKLSLEGKEGSKKVSFKLSEEKLEKEEKKRISEICSEIVGIEIKNLEEERKNIKDELRGFKEKIKDYEERMDRVESRLGEIAEWINRREEEKQREERDSVRGEEARGSSTSVSERDNSSMRSEGTRSLNSNLSIREVERIRKWVSEKNKEDRRKNVVFKGVRIPKEIGNDRKKGMEWAENLIREKMCVSTKVTGCRESGTVIVISFNSEEDKREVMSNKFRLKGGNIFVENDLSWEERSIQAKINKWVKEQRGKGLEVKAGIGRVRVKGIWRSWKDIEKDRIGKEGEEEEKDKDKDKGKDKAQRERNF